MAPNDAADDPRAGAMARATLPVIDLGEPGAADPAARAALVARLRAACMTDGFFYLVGHGVPDALLGEVVAQARRLFALDEAAKQAIAATHPSGLGYGRMGGRMLSGRPGARVKEEFYYRHPVAQGPEPNRWPEGMPGFRPPLERYVDLMHALAARVMGLLAETLGMPADGFARFCEDPLATVRLVRYPAEGAEAGAHTDFGALTFLLQDGTGGLQLRDRTTGAWLHAEPLPGAFLVNLGDLFEVWTNRTYRSTAHRVVHPPGRERISVPFFFTGAADHVVACLPGFRHADGSADLPPVTPAGHLHAGHAAQGF